MNPQTQNRLVALAIGAGTIAYLKPWNWKKTESKTEDVPDSKLSSPDLGQIKKDMQEKEKPVGGSQFIQEKGRDQVITAKDEPQKRNWWFSDPKEE